MALVPFRVLGAAADQDMEQRMFHFGGKGPCDNCATQGVTRPLLLPRRALHCIVLAEAEAKDFQRCSKVRPSCLSGCIVRTRPSVHFSLAAGCGDSPEKPLLHSFKILWMPRQVQKASLHCAGMAITVRQIPKHSGSVARAALPQGEHSQAGDRGCPCKDRAAVVQIPGG